MASAVMKLCAILMIVGAVAADVSELVPNAQPVTEVCLGCLCQAVSGCKAGLQCEGDSCGLFHITWPYWADAGKPTLPGQSNQQPDAYSNCAVDPYCAAQTVQNYMSRFAKDCNNDGSIDCRDYIRIHKKGGYGCDGPLDPRFETVFNQCIDAVSKAQQSQG